MPRDVFERWRVEGTLVARTAIHVGGLAGDPDTDLPLARNGANAWCVPGTSLAGAFRAWWEEAFNSPLTKLLWGFVPDKGAGDGGWASFVLVGDAPLDVAGGAVELRDGVGIDRRYGAAADRIKHDRAVLPAGTTLPLALTIEVCGEERRQLVEAMLGHFLRALIGGGIPLGAARTRGLGRVALRTENLVIRRQTLKDRAGMLATLRNGGTPIAWETLDLGAATPAPSRRLRIELAWEALGPVMSRGARDGLDVDTLPLMGRRDGSLHPLLTGAGIKGTLRAQAERIVRTVLNLPPAGDSFLEQVRVPLVRTLFGDPGEASSTRLGRGALSVEDCFARWTTDEAGHRAMATRGEAKGWRATHHVAIDRWTGGAADGLLFSVLEPPKLTWEPIRIELDLSRLDDDKTLPALSLLLLVLDDLAAGRLPLGFAGNRGMGALMVTGITAVVDEEETAPAGAAAPDTVVRAVLRHLSGKPLEGGVLANLDEAHRERLHAAWQAWIETATAGGTPA